MAIRGAIRFRLKIRTPDMFPKDACCPCCNFQTLNANGGYEICVICWWEDDGQSTKEANETYDGPNGKYSLTLAKANFAKHGHMYNEGEGIKIVEQPSEARQRLMAYLKTIKYTSGKETQETLAPLLLDAHKAV